MEKMLSWKKPSSGVTLSHKKPLLGITTKSHYWALRWTLYTSKKGPSYQKEVRRMTKALWPNFVPRAASWQFQPIRGDFHFSISDDVIARMLNY